MAEAPAPTTSRAPAGQRGRLDLADRVVVKVATRAAAEPDGVVATAAADRSAVGDAVQRVVRTDLPRAEAAVGGGATRVQVKVATRWPASAPETAALVREHVAQRVSELTGLRVDGVDVAVTTQVAGPSVPDDVLTAPMARAPRPVRSTRLVLLGLVAALLAGVVGVVAVQSALVEAGWLVTSSWWGDAVTAVGVVEPREWFVPAGIAAVVVGLVVLGVALAPGRRSGLTVGSSTGTWMSARDVARFASGAAETVDGVLSASTSVSRRSVVVSVRSTGPDLRDLVRSAVAQRLSVLDPAPTVVVRQRSVTS